MPGSGCYCKPFREEIDRVVGQHALAELNLGMEGIRRVGGISGSKSSASLPVTPVETSRRPNLSQRSCGEDAGPRKPHDGTGYFVDIGDLAVPMPVGTHIASADFVSMLRKRFTCYRQIECNFIVCHLVVPATNSASLRWAKSELVNQ